MVEDVLEILRERGIIDEAKHAELVSKNQAYEEENQGLLGRIEWSGDFRARLEHLWYDRDDTGSNRADRTRARYRLRITGKAKVNDYTKVVFRLASGTGDIRSTNKTFGSGNDFDPDGIFIDRAYVEFKAPKTWLGESTGVKAIIGKTKNPFLWKNGKDYMLWDHDINPEGGALMVDHQFSDAMRAYVTGGYYVIDENSTSEDPHMTGFQGGVDYSPAELLDVGARGSFYSFASLNESFLGRSTAVGAVTDDDYRVFELAGYLRYRGIEDWPVLIFGHYARNLDAGKVSSFTGSDEDTGWGVGLEVGDKKKYLKLGFGYYAVEANFFPAQFTDSDLFDGRTNRKGFTLYGSKQILSGTDLNITLFQSNELRSGLPVFASSVRNADRLRLQTDLVVKF
ncbi:MAG: hypothetical protein GY723_11920 [bacterium]|nr:hypothetical protein [bacterium]